MKKLRRVLLIAAGGVLAFLVVLLLAVNLYVQSQATQARIQQELTQRLGATLSIQRISVTPWSGLKLTGITMPQSDAAVAGKFLKADTFRLRIRFLSLFARRLVIDEVSLVHPNVVWAQNANGKWRLPVAAPQTETSAPAAAEMPAASASSAEPALNTPLASAAPPVVSTVPSQVPATAPSDNTVETASSTEEQAAVAPFTPEVRRVTLTNGNFHFLDMHGQPVATFEGVDFRSTLRSGSALRGRASIAKVSLRDRFYLEKLESPIRYDVAALDFSQIHARAADGEVTGEFSMNPADPGSPFGVKVKFRDVQADRVVTDAGGPGGMVQGRIEGELNATGKTADANALAGTGEIYLRDGQVRQYRLLVALGQILQIDELAQLHFNEAQVKYHITPGVVTVDEMLLSSANIRLSAHGTVSFNGNLRLESQLAINDKIQSQLFRAVRGNFQPVEPAGYSAVNFQVSGTIDKPKTNLMKKLVGGELSDIGSVLDSFLGGGKSERAKKKAAFGAQPPQPEQTPPAPDETASPASTAPTP